MKITEKEFLEAEIGAMNLTMNNPQFVALAKQVGNYLKKYKQLSAIDYGCGTGVYSEVLRKDGFNIIAQDVFKVHRDYCKENYPDLKVVARPAKAELMLFIEVAEHMTNEEIETAIKKIDPEFILFSSTPEKTNNDADWGHINIKNEQEWASFWFDLGYKLIDKPKTPTMWALMLKKI
jgi:2-polyprenyl-3-methyl-5-hydroxy-6-metoxy-1,4-benzoquinol methylase